MSGSTSSAQASGGAVVIASRAAVATCQADETAIAVASRTVATRGSPSGGPRVVGGAHAAATRSTPPKRRASRVTFVPTGDGTIQVTSTTRTYTAAPSRTVSHDVGTRSRTTAPRTTGMTSEISPIGCRPANGKNTAENATTATGGTDRQRRRRPGRATGRRPRCRGTAPPPGSTRGGQHRQDPGQSAAGQAVPPRGVRQCSGHAKITATAPRANSVPRPNVTRPETALQVIAAAPYNAGHRGRSMALLRTSTSASSAAESEPATIMVVRTPASAMRYGDRML